MAMRNDKTTQLISTDTQSTQCLQQLTCADISQASARSPCERGGAFA